MKYVELAEGGLNIRGHIVPKSDVSSTVREFPAFYSLFPFTEEIVSHMEFMQSADHPKGTVTGYAGGFHCDMVAFDFDSHESLDDARKDLGNVIRLFGQKYKIPTDAMFPYFSGGKGFHLLLPIELFGGIDPDPDVPYVIGRLAEKIAQEVEAPTMDLSIYNKSRFFRIPNSLHEKSGLYKIPLLTKEVILKTGKQIQEMAQEPRKNPFSPVRPRRNDKLQALLRIAQAPPSKSKADKDLIGKLPKEDAERFEIAKKVAMNKKDYVQGNKNNYIFYLGALCNDLGIGPEGDPGVAEEFILKHLDENHGDPIDSGRRKEVEKAIASAYRNRRGNYGSFKIYVQDAKESEKIGEYKTEVFLTEKAQSLSRRSTFRINEILQILLAFNANRETEIPEEKVYEIALRSVKGRARRPDGYIGMTVNETLEKYVDRYARKNAEMPTGFAPLDEAEGCDYRGRAWAILGPGGVGKSALLAQFARQFAKSGFHTIYSTMEDTSVNQGKRMIKSGGPYVDPDTSEAKDLEELSRTMIKQGKAKEILQALKQDIGDQYGSNLYFDDIARMSGDDYKYLIEAHIQKFGRADNLLVDGLSLMQSSGNELVDAGENSAQLKEVANMFDIPVFALVHVPREAAHGVRNLEEFGRGSHKIKDNFDGFISLSLCENAEKSVMGAPVYYDNLIYVRIYGKRTTGKIVEFIAERDSFTMEYSVREDINPAHFNNPDHHDFYNEGWGPLGRIEEPGSKAEDNWRVPGASAHGTISKHDDYYREN